MKTHLPLKVDPTPWLLACSEPVVRYWTLVDILHRPHDDPDVAVALAAIARSPIVTAIMARRTRHGLWGPAADYYLPKHCGTFWTLCVLGDLALTVADECIRLACDYMLGHQASDGAFRREHMSTGAPEDVPMPCTHARITRFLVQFGLGNAPQAQKAVNWLLATQKKTGGWQCGRSATSRGCLRATIDYLRLAVLVPGLANAQATTVAAEWVYNLLLEPGMGRYHVGDTWDVLTYPEVGYSLLGALDALTRLGYHLDRPKIASSAEVIIAKQDAGGCWRMDEGVSKPPADFGLVHMVNPWLTLDAMRVLKRL